LVYTDHPIISLQQDVMNFTKLLTHNTYSVSMMCTNYHGQSVYQLSCPSYCILTILPSTVTEDVLNEPCLRSDLKMNKFCSIALSAEKFTKMRYKLLDGKFLL